MNDVILEALHEMETAVANLDGGYGYWQRVLHRFPLQHAAKPLPVQVEIEPQIVEDVDWLAFMAELTD